MIVFSYITSADFKKRNLRKLITFASVKLYISITLINRPGQHIIFFRYARHNYLRCPMMEEVSRSVVSLITLLCDVKLIIL